MKPRINFHILTLFPEIFGCLSHSVIKKAERKEIIKINTYNLRDWGEGQRKQVDDKSFGGGVGMLLRVDIIDAAIKSIKQKTKNKKTKTILLTPQGKPYKQEDARRFSKEKNIILICGHYEGFDERIREYLTDEEISIGDYVLTGGELPAMVLVDSISRLIPGVLGKEESVEEESFQIQNTLQSHSHSSLSDRGRQTSESKTGKAKNKKQKLLEYPQYTRPASYKKWKVPKILLSGNHKKIAAWRLEKSKENTRKKRPDLLKFDS